MHFHKRPSNEKQEPTLFRVVVIENLFEIAEATGLYPEALAPSPIEGGDGNREYLALFRVGEKREHPPIDIAKIVYDTPKGE